MRTPLLKEKSNTTLVDSLMTVAAIIHPMTAVPQVVQIYATKNVSGLNLATWLGFILVGAIFLAYALAHRIKPIILTQVLWFIMDAWIAIGILLYS